MEQVFLLLIFGTFVCVHGISKGPEYHALKEKLPTCEVADKPLNKFRCVLPQNMQASRDSRPISECFCPAGTRCIVQDQDARDNEFVYTCVSVAALKNIEKSASKYSQGLHLKEKTHPTT